MQTNYKIKDGIYLVADELELDLHNNYNFVGLEYSVENRAVKLVWQRGTGDWIEETLPKKVELNFERVSSFEFHPRDPEMPFSEDDCLSDAGYLLEQTWCEAEVFTPAGDPDPDWKIAFGFQSGAIIALKAEVGTASIQP